MSLPALSMGPNAPFFTIEQFELVRRLRNSGVTKEQVIQAFEAFDRLDTDLGKIFTLPQAVTPTVPKVSPVPQQTSYITPVTVNIPETTTQTPTQPQTQAQPIRPKALILQTAKASSSTEVVQSKFRRILPNPDEEQQPVVRTVPVLLKKEEIQPREIQIKDVQPPQKQSSKEEVPATLVRPKRGRPRKRPYSPPLFGVDNELILKLAEFKKLPASKRLEEILATVTAAGMTVPEIATQTGLTEYTIGKFLEGGSEEVSSNQRRSIYLWYLLHLSKIEESPKSPDSPLTPNTAEEKTISVKQEEKIAQPQVDMPPKPLLPKAPQDNFNLQEEKIGQPKVAIPPKPLLPKTPQANFNLQEEKIGQPKVAIPPKTLLPKAPQDNFTGQESGKPIEPCGSLVLNDSFQRRDRFTFRDCHLKILDKAFRENQYPSAQEREEIAEYCNMTMFDLKGRALSQREKVCVAIVSNWFNNRRKEAKKVARQEGIKLSDVILPQPKLTHKHSCNYSILPTAYETQQQEADSNVNLEPIAVNDMVYTVTRVKEEPPDSDDE